MRANQRIALLTLVVADYDEAIAFYTQKLHFRLIEDTDLGSGKRWVRVAPRGVTGGTELLLARASTPEQATRVGNQTGGRVALFLYTDNLARDYQQLLAAGVSIVRPPATEPYGRVLVFADLYGNLWDLLEPASGQSV
ncbi:catechol 2,3-dioxygenase-like lactoylglutathione lyase family enzyme [Hymenobacter luteus]|uniref:Catechol 2,3-dioxygenase-like lactoylglutathione lyase family enzyme n=2 Tax=Hymenobacter TaxID=89966 RepID=A0A7W9T1F9_9BACT|nr:MULTISPECIES: VOC family protein [Hymenobacter]MBB4601719.1 catechol 2,3-dioxygenase-like lactoylglutathione lyase family enzyme [Hymenobacter latericoloratus]MBB6059852.1 catechol 2,3-dioxygenase-like lactoylglutathione lyase family enzyme [Hymenobacter luteus]